MFPKSYFPPSYFAPSYWPKTGGHGVPQQPQPNELGLDFSSHYTFWQFPDMSNHYTVWNYPETVTLNQTERCP